MGALQDWLDKQGRFYVEPSCCPDPEDALAHAEPLDGETMDSAFEAIADHGYDMNTPLDVLMAGPVSMHLAVADAMEQIPGG